MMRHHRHQPGISLLEVIVAASILAVLAVTTLEGLVQARHVRSNARERVALALLAQEELDRARLIPAMDVREGSAPLRREGWTPGTAGTLTYTRRPDGTWLLEVEMTRDLAGGLMPVRLATIRR